MEHQWECLWVALGVAVNWCCKGQYPDYADHELLIIVTFKWTSPFWREPRSSWWTVAWGRTGASRGSQQTRLTRPPPCPLEAALATSLLNGALGAGCAKCRLPTKFYSHFRFRCRRALLNASRVVVVFQTPNCFISGEMFSRPSLADYLSFSPVYRKGLYLSF